MWLYLSDILFLYSSLYSYAAAKWKSLILLVLSDLTDLNLGLHCLSLLDHPPPIHIELSKSSHLLKPTQMWSLPLSFSDLFSWKQYLFFSLTDLISLQVLSILYTMLMLFKKMVSFFYWTISILKKRPCLTHLWNFYKTNTLCLSCNMSYD